MKTSNKLLIGFFTVVVITMVAGTWTIKHKIDKNIDKIHQTMPNITIESDSIQQDSL